MRALTLLFEDLLADERRFLALSFIRLFLCVDDVLSDRRAFLVLRSRPLVLLEDALLCLVLLTPRVF